MEAVSDIASVDRTAPLITFVESIVNHKSNQNLKEIELVDLDKFSKKIKKQKPKKYSPIFTTYTNFFTSKRSARISFISSK